MFDKILIANRGEIALRVLRACGTWHCDRRGAFDRRRQRHACPPGRRKRLHRPAAKGQLSERPALLAACEITGADAVHPGYGFLSENAASLKSSRTITCISSARRPSTSA
jgi:acetyl-CoA carboxylase biotin carboxylase subunit